MSSIKEVGVFDFDSVLSPSERHFAAQNADGFTFVFFSKHSDFFNLFASHDFERIDVVNCNRLSTREQLQKLFRVPLRFFSKEGFLEQFTDQSARPSAEVQIPELEKVINKASKTSRLLRSLFENAPELILLIDKNKKVLFKNRSLQRFFERHLGVMVKDNAPLPGASADNMVLMLNFHENIQKALEGSAFETEIFATNHAHQYYAFSFTPVYNDFCAIEGISILGKNISESKIAEVELTKARHELNSVVYKSSHNLRAPISRLKGLLSVIEIELGDRLTSPAYFSLMETCLQELEVYTEEINNYAKLQMEITLGQIEYIGIIGQSIQELKYLPGGSIVESQISIDETATFYSDPIRIKILINNLVSNALKYFRPHVNNPYYRLEITSNEEWSQIVYSDNGRGIPEKFLDRIFDMYYRATEQSGSGLGLYMVKEIVESLDGSIEVHSEIDKGTTFIIRLKNFRDRFVSSNSQS